MWKVVTIEKVDTRRFGEIDTTPDAGLLLELAEEVDQALTGKEERFADDLRGKDFGEAADLDILDARDRREARGLPSTADHADPGPADVDFVQPATDGLLDDLGQGLAQTSRIAGRADSTVEQSAERVGSAADRKLSQGAEETGSVVERAGEQAGRAIATGGSATATAVETTGETADQHAETFGRVVGASNGVATEAVTAVVDVAAEPAGDTVATAVRTTSGGVGGATAAVGDGAGAVAESAGDRAGDAVKHTTKVAGEVASAPLDVVEQAATIQRQATEAAEKTVDDLLGGL